MAIPRASKDQCVYVKPLLQGLGVAVVWKTEHTDCINRVCVGQVPSSRTDVRSRSRRGVFTEAVGDDVAFNARSRVHVSAGFHCRRSVRSKVGKVQMRTDVWKVYVLKLLMFWTFSGAAFAASLSSSAEYMYLDSWSRSQMKQKCSITDALKL